MAQTDEKDEESFEQRKIKTSKKNQQPQDLMADFVDKLSFKLGEEGSLFL